jgi:hypothetical protein
VQLSSSTWRKPEFKEMLYHHCFSTYAISRVQANQEDLKLNNTHQLLVYADDVNILGGSIHTIKKNNVALVVASKEIGLEVNAEKTKYIYGDFSRPECRMKSQHKDR